VNIGSVTDETKTELIEQLNIDGSFSDWGRGRLANVDRFLSNFHKPLQRRMLFTRPKDKLPPTGVIRLKATQEIFLVGASRQDSSNDAVFDRLSVLHVVSNDSSGIAEYFNYHHDLATPLVTSPVDIGKRSEGTFYLSVEYASTKGAESGDEAYQGKFLVYSQLTTPFKRDGIFTVNGSSYKVVQPFHDSGFSCAIVLQQKDDMVPIVYLAIDETTSGYNVTSGVQTLNHTKITIAGTVDHTRTDAHNRSTYSVYLKNDQLPVEITSGNSLLLPSNRTVKILAVTEDVNTQGQLHLTCEGN